MLQNNLPAIQGYPSIIDESDIGNFFINGSEVTPEDIGKMCWFVTDGHHRSTAAYNAKLPYVFVELDYSTITNAIDKINFLGSNNV